MRLVGVSRDTCNVLTIGSFIMEGIHLYADDVDLFACFAHLRAFALPTTVVRHWLRHMETFATCRKEMPVRPAIGV